MTVLVDYYGQEITDTLAVCRRFPELAARGELSIRLDTHGSRYVEGLDMAKSYAVLERYSPNAVREYRTEAELRWLTAPASAPRRSSTCARRSTRPAFETVKIVASSGFGPAKCRVMASVNAPIDVIGTGSFLPENWSETFATADVVDYDGTARVKLGREFLLRNGADGSPRSR